MNSKNIILNDSAKIDLTCQSSLNDILIVGNFNGMFGRIDESGLDLSGEPSEEIINNFMWLNDTCRDAKKVFIGTRSSVGDYVKNMIAAAENLGIQINRDKYNIILVDSDDELLNKLNEISHTMPKFDYIIQNPPYAKTLHIDFFKKGIELLNDTGKMTIIEPATWALSMRDDTKCAKLYQDMKTMINGITKKLIIENLAQEFNNCIFVPYSITYIDKTYTGKIDYQCFGEHIEVDSIYECNHVFSNGVFGIIEKIRAKKLDSLENHYNKINGDNFIRSSHVFSNHGYYSKANVYERVNVKYYTTYIQPLVHHTKQDIYDKIPCKLTGVNKGKEGDFISGTFNELENWKYFALNNSLSLFLCIIFQFALSRKEIPWLVDKQYTDQEIYEMFGFTEQEINLIEYTVEKFQYSSPFFKRYMCGPSKVSDQEVQEYINQLKKKHNIDY